MSSTDVVVIGGGQAGLAAGYHLRRQGLGFVVLDAGAAAGGAWQHMWDSLHLFSPAAYSSLPGRLMPAQAGETYPGAGHVVPGRSTFTGRQLHTMNYRSPTDFAGQRVIVVGGGNSGAQIAADLALDGRLEVTWVTQRPPRFLPDDIDGRALFDVATARRRDLDAGREDTGGVASLGDVVAVPPLRAARDAGLLTTKPMFAELTATGVRWADGSQSDADAVIWSTGFRPALSHLAALNLRGPRGYIPTDGTRALGEPRLHLLGYGDWTGPASATLIGVGRPARDAARAIAQLL
ncbi:FAD-dependent oxidoreductase [[Kitasatospora] papulosa]|uniref:FAD-dependent oxidoreductase n=1 Tax=[Kitasatospora] papulosa TaxID=1464011 RepID=UPI0036DFD182